MEKFYYKLEIECNWKNLNVNNLYLLIITVCSSIILFSPIIIGPAWAIIFTFGWINVLGPYYYYYYIL